MEAVAVQVCGIQRTQKPEAKPAAAIIFAADHPVCRHGVSAYPQEVTRAMVANFVAGGAAASVLCRRAKVPLHVVDVGVLSVGVNSAEVVDGVRLSVAPRAGRAGDLRTEDAMDQDAFDAAWDAGAQAVSELESDVKVVILGDMGIGNTTPAAAVAASLLGRPAAEIVGRGTGVDDSGLQNKVQVVSDGLRRIAEAPSSDEGDGPLAVLRRVGGREMVAIASAATAAAGKGMAILVDGFIVTAAVLAAVRHEPRLREHLIFAHQSQELGHRLMLEALDGRALLNLGFRLGEASGALAALDLVDQGCCLHREMATFAAAGVPDQDAL